MRYEKKVRYSPLELRVLALIPEDGRKINTLELAGKAYPAGEVPHNARESILHIANRLIHKSDLNEEIWEIFKSAPRGSQPAYFWREERKKK